jgi:hypothetical protein
LAMAFQTESVHEVHPQRDVAVVGVAAVTGGVTGDNAGGGATPVIVAVAATGACVVLPPMVVLACCLLLLLLLLLFLLLFPLRRAVPLRPPRSTAWTEKDKNMTRVRSKPCMVLCCVCETMNNTMYVMEGSKIKPDIFIYQYEILQRQSRWPILWVKVGGTNLLCTWPVAPCYCAVGTIPAVWHMLFVSCTSEAGYQCVYWLYMTWRYRYYYSLLRKISPLFCHFAKLFRAAKMLLRDLSS